YRQNTDGSNSRVIAGQLTTYRQNEANTNFVVPDQIYLWESALPVPSVSYGRVSTNSDNSNLIIDANQRPRINMLGYDSYGNVLSVAKINDVTVSYFYGYNHSLPIAEVKDALNTTSAKEIFYESFEESNSASVITNTSLSHAGKNYVNGAYTTTFVIPNSKSYKLEYWYLANGKWNYNTKAYTGAGMILNDGSAVDDVRIYPVDAQMKSYTYDPILGMTSVIDEGGIMHSYDYDNFGRLKMIRNDQGVIEKQYIYKYKN
ncbi:MAG TPA: hypothetical protein VIM65_04290, partial [Cyclobacteriaceae bacterium]